MPKSSKRATITQRVLNSFKRRKPCGVSKVAKALDLPRSRVAARTLELESRGLVRRVGYSTESTGIKHLVYRAVA
jgi:DNA-binding IclR family transcriptional regulator